MKVTLDSSKAVSLCQVGTSGPKDGAVSAGGGHMLGRAQRHVKSRRFRHREKSSRDSSGEE